MERYIYKVTNIINGKIYIGQTKNFKDRIRTHIKDANGTRSNMVFHKAIRKYGIDNFNFEIIYTGDEILIDEIEVYYIRYFNSHCKLGWGYNSSFGKANKGFSHTDEYKQMMSIRMKGHKYNLGRKHTPEEIEHLRKINTGKKRSEETKQTMNILKINTKIFTFSNENDKLIFNGNMNEFSKKYNLDRSCVTKLINGKRNIHKGWILINS